MDFSTLSKTVLSAVQPYAGMIQIPAAWIKAIDESPLLTLLVILLLFLVAFILFRLVYSFVMKSIGIITFTLNQRKGKKRSSKPLTVPSISLDPLTRVLKAIKYLTKKKEWRYATPWYLLIGDEKGNKDELINSLDSGKRQSLLIKEKKLGVNDTGWHFFNNGIVINVDDDFFDHDKKKDNAWETMLHGIAGHRPERPADGVIITVSFEDLKENRKLLKESGYLFYKRLLKIQDIFSFSLPVYLVVSGCEKIEGFSSFWNAQAEHHLHEMFGWSNPFQSNLEYLPEWVDLAFDQIFKRLQEAQIRSVSSEKSTDDPDGFFLFPYHFRELRKALKEFASAVFKTSSYHASFPLRGIYFSGVLEHQHQETEEVTKIQCFSRDLFERKIFAEQNLAMPTHEGIISRNRIIKNFQFSMIGISIVLFSVFIINEASLIYRVERIKEVAGVIQKGAKDCSEEGSRVYNILDKITEIESDPLYFSFIKSWYDKLPEKLGKYIAEDCLTQSVYKSLECRLEKKATELEQTLSDSTRTDYQTFLSTMNDVKNFEDNLSRFMVLCSSNENESDEEIIDNFGKLLSYLYTGGIPDALKDKKDLHVNTLKRVRYTPSWMRGEVFSLYDFRTLFDYLNEGDIHQPVKKKKKKLITILEDSLRDINWNEIKHKAPKKGKCYTSDYFKKLAGFLRKDLMHSAFKHHKKDLVALLEDISKDVDWDKIEEDGNHEACLVSDIYRPAVDRKKMIAPMPDTDSVIARINILSERLQAPIYEGLKVPYDINTIITDKDNSILPFSAAREMDTWINGIVDGKWMESKQKSPCFWLENVIDTVNVSLDKAGYETVVKELDYAECFSGAKQILLSQSISPDGQLFFVKGDDSFEMAKNTQLNKIGLTELLNTEFMQYRIKDMAYRDGTPVAWDKSKLTLAIKLYREYEGFLSGQTTKTNVTLFYETIAEKQIRLTLKQLLYEAQVGRGEIVHTGPVFMPVEKEEAYLSADVANLDSVKEEIVQMLMILNDDQFSYIMTDLLNATTAYCVNLLEKTDGLVNTGRLYQPVNDPDWTPTILSSVLYDLDTPVQIKDYLKAQQNRVQYISLNYAQPVVQFLMNIGNIQSTKRYRPFKRWYNTLKEIDKYQKHDPESHLAKLENYFTRTLAARTLKTYEQQQSQAVSGVDLFAVSLTRIEKKILKNVTGFETSEIETSYQDLTERFNRDLTSKFPFAEPDKTEGDVDISVLSKFVNDYKKSTAQIDEIVSDNTSATYSEKAKNYVEQMDSVVDFFDKALNTVGNEPGALLVKPEFRVLSQQYDGSNQVVEWEFKSGILSSGYPSTGSTDKLYWQNGDPVELNLRWATGSDYKPEKTANSVSPEIMDRTVRYRYDGDLNLVKFLIDNRDSDQETANEKDIMTLFKIPVVNTKCSEKDGDCSETIKLYINFKLYAKNTKTDSWETIAMPEMFPAYAPELQQPLLVE